MTLPNIILFLATVCVALMAGLLFSYACSVVPALKQLPDKEYISAMQSINKAIQNPVFFLVFFGALILLPAITVMTFSQPLCPREKFLLAASIIYIIGVFGVTALGNIPLNNVLAKFDLLNASKEMISNHRSNFEQRWNNFNLLRTIASIIALLLVLAACFASNKTTQVG